MTRAEFNSLVNNLSRKLFGIAYRILGNEELSKDAVQEIMIKLWNMNAKLSGYESVDALSVTMIKNHCIDLLRKSKIRPSAPEGSMSFTEDPGPTPQEILERSESYESIQRIIDSLPGMYREIIYLRDIEGLEYDEIVKNTGQNINTLRVNLSRARKIVRDEYQKYFRISGHNI